MKSKTRFLFLVGGALLLLLLSYVMALSKTFAVRKDYNGLKKEERLYKDVSQQYKILSQKEVYYDSILTHMNLTDTSLENNLLKTINEEAANHNLKVKDFKTPHVFLSNGTKQVSYNFTLEGGYTAILRLLYTLESTGTFGEIIHLNFQKETDFRTRRKYLTAQILLQSIQ
ncbi:hypothetical protein [uncultured Croceitalea sp.]|uniref:hypothetical protein n=1 Tax=uncultured Croceitalea sp. TaxID=1798908 RepID=UPI00330631B0